MVMWKGHAVEIGPAKQVISNPKHPYTKALLAAVPTLRPGQKLKAPELTGDIPLTPLREIASNHFAAC